MKSPEMPSQHGGSKKPKKKIWLITPEQFKQLPDGTEITSISGEKKVKGQDEVDQDTRYGFLAWGFPEHAKPAGIKFDERGTSTLEDDEEDEG